MPYGMTYGADGKTYQIVPGEPIVTPQTYTTYVPQTTYQQKQVQVPVQQQVAYRKPAYETKTATYQYMAPVMEEQTYQYQVPVQTMEDVQYQYQVPVQTFEEVAVQVPKTVMVPQTTYETVMQKVPKTTYEVKTATQQVPRMTYETKTGTHMVPKYTEEYQTVTSMTTQTVQEPVTVQVPVQQTVNTVQMVNKVVEYKMQPVNTYTVPGQTYQTMGQQTMGQPVASTSEAPAAVPTASYGYAPQYGYTYQMNPQAAIGSTWGYGYGTQATEKKAEETEI